MSNISSKMQVLEYLKKTSKSFEINQLEPLSTICIATTLNMSRSLTSQYLNELVKEEQVIKICSRPVYYFDRNEIEKKYHVEMKQLEYVSAKEFFDSLHETTSPLLDFEKAIGNEGSLQYCMSQIKSTLLYPDGGLPVLLYGEKGVGKSYLVQLIHEYCLNHKLLTNKSILVKMKLLRSELPSKHKTELFGSYDEVEKKIKKGKLEEADGGILYLQDIDNLSEDCQELLADYISTGQFTRVGDEGRKIKCQVRIIMSCQVDPQSALFQNLLLNIPVICNIPELSKRNDDERRRFILKFFREEQELLDIPIYIPERMLMLLMRYDFESNINELKKCIKSVCANAYAQTEDKEKLYVYMYHLPVLLLDQVQVEMLHQDQEQMLRIDVLEQLEKHNKILMMWDQILAVHKQEPNSMQQFMQEGQKILRHYYDILVFQENYSDIRLSSMEKIVLNILQVIKSSRNINLPINCGYVLTRMILSSQMNNTMLKQWELDHREEVKEIISMMKQNMLNEYIISELILKQIHSHVNVRLHEMNLVFLMMNISLYNKDIHSQDTVGIILSHGYSTASSIADAANSLLSTFIFEAIDMPLDIPVQEVSSKLDTFISENRHIKNIILLVDMGSLEDIGTVIADSVNVGVINNISTSLALNIGMKIIQHYELEEILKVACEEAQCHYKVLSIAKKEKAIIFTNDAGKVVSEKLSKLFRDSLPKEIELKMMEYDYNELLKNGNQDILFKKYDVLLMIKPYNLKIENVNCVTLEEIMNFKNVDKVNQVLRMYLNSAEIDAFDQSLLKNFSMQSVMENLTILNAPKLLDYVSESINALQHIMNRRFQSRTIVGIYIHICFLVERLVTKTALDRYENLSEFESTQQAFIKDVNRSFDTMLSHYNVKLPVSEIAYLYEYIEHDGGNNDDEF